MEHNIPITRNELNQGLLTQMTMQNQEQGSVPRILSVPKLAQSPTQINSSYPFLQTGNVPKIKERVQRIIQTENILQLSIVNDATSQSIIDLKNARKAQQMFQRQKVDTISSKDLQSVCSSDTQFKPINTNSSVYANEHIFNKRSLFKPKIKMISSRQSLDSGVQKPKKHLFLTTQSNQILLTGKSINQEKLDAEISDLPYRNAHTQNQSISSNIQKQTETSYTFKPIQASAQKFSSSQNFVRDKDLSESPESPSPNKESLKRIFDADVSDSSPEGLRQVPELQLFKVKNNNIGMQESIQKVYNRFRMLNLQQPKTMRPEIYKTEKHDTRREPRPN